MVAATSIVQSQSKAIEILVAILHKRRTPPFSKGTPNVSFIRPSLLIVVEISQSYRD